jgi:hypothetical protein
VKRDGQENLGASIQAGLVGGHREVGVGHHLTLNPKSRSRDSTIGDVRMKSWH